MSQIIRTDVTAVKFFGNFVLAGMGSSIHVFERDGGKVVQRINSLNAQKIHGIEPLKSDGKIIIFGGKQFTVISLGCSTNTDPDNSLFERLFDPILCDDWLHSIIWLDNQIVAILTAHNLVQKWDTSTQTLVSQHPSENNSILYSGLLVPLNEDVLVLAGTVFSKVIIHRCGDEMPLHNLEGHRGVIFSISCNLQKGIIVTTSDDRSARIWELEATTHSYNKNTIEYWKNVSITCKDVQFGHTARVMRSCITDNLVISVGEDSALCFWNFQGELLKKVDTHQNGCIWSVDADEHHLVTGGGECGIILHPLSVAKYNSVHQVFEIDKTPKKIVLTARRNLVVLNDDDELIYIDTDSGRMTVQKLVHESTCKYLSISSCKQLVAVTDMKGNIDIFFENCEGDPSLEKVINAKMNTGDILSMQWAGNRHIVLSARCGLLTVLASDVNGLEIYAHFELPISREQLVTASATDAANRIFALGDRCGTVHIYVKGRVRPVRSFSAIHGKYGPTSINIHDDIIVTTGRDGTAKYFSIKGPSINFMVSKDLDFPWVEKFLDKDDDLVCGFHASVFVVHSLKTKLKVLTVPCGGGHRSWDAMRYFAKVDDENEEMIRLAYIKHSQLHMDTFQISKLASKNIMDGSHAKEINCMKTYKHCNDKEMTFYISGGEDTSLRISSINSELQFKDEFVFKHLSNVRTLKTHIIDDNNFILISAGGRAQICVKQVNFTSESNNIKVTPYELIDYMIKGPDKRRRGFQTWRECTVDFDPETRIMDLDLISTELGFTVFAGCSDGCLRVFQYQIKRKIFAPVKDVKYHTTCILKTHCIKFVNKDIVVTCATRGVVTFWEVTYEEEFDVQPFYSMNANKSGINCIASKVISDKDMVIATGGDDNALHLNALEIPDRNNLSSIKVSHSWSCDQYHSSQITGLCIVDNFLLSASIDQRITLVAWDVGEQGITCTSLSQTYSDVADIQGMEVMENSEHTITVCVFGKGMEVIEIPKSKIE